MRETEREGEMLHNETYTTNPCYRTLRLYIANTTHRQRERETERKREREREKERKREREKERKRERE